MYRCVKDSIAILEIEYHLHWNKDSDLFLLKESQMVSVKYYKKILCFRDLIMNEGIV